MSKLDLIIKALQVSYAHVPGDIADRHHEALVAARELMDQLAKPEQKIDHQNPAAKHWHDMYRAKCKDFHDAQARLGAEIVALEEELAELKEEQLEPPFKLTDAGADTNIDPFTLHPKGVGMVALHQSGAWHYTDCAGECIACLIEKVVTEAYGTQGLEYLRKRVSGLKENAA